MTSSPDLPGGTGSALEPAAPDVYAERIYFVVVPNQSIPKYNWTYVFEYIKIDCFKHGIGLAWASPESLLLMTECNAARMLQIVVDIRQTVRNFGGNPKEVQFYRTEKVNII